MPSEKFIRCCNCQAIHHVTPFDRAPIYTYCGGEIHEEPTDDGRRFMQQHASHRLEPVEATGEQFFPCGPSADPMSTGYIEVTNGRERYVLRRTRKTIEEPLNFEIVSGSLRKRGVTLEVQENTIRKEMRYHFWPPCGRLREDQIDRFIGAIKRVVERLDPQTVQPTEISFTDKNLSYGRLDDVAIEAIVVECARHFAPPDLESVRRFIDARRDGSDLMTVVMRRHWTIEQPAG